MPTIPFLDDCLNEIANRTAAGGRCAVTFDIDNTLVDTRGRALAVGALFDARYATTWFQGKSPTDVGNDAKETATLLALPEAEAALLKKFWFRYFLKGKYYEHDLPIAPTIALANDASAAGAHVHYVTARTQSEAAFTLAELARVGLPVLEPSFVVHKAHLKGDSTAVYKTNELRRIAAAYDYVPWFLTESRADLRGIQKLGPPVQTVLLHTRFSGNATIDPATPIWSLDL